MNLVDRLYHSVESVSAALGLRRPLPALGEFVLEPARIEALKRQSTSGIHKTFIEGGARTVHKWEQYLDVYEQHFAKYRGTDLFFLEIGVLDGGSLEMWRRYFGPQATIVGIDIEPACASHVDAPNHVRIGSQDDPAFLSKVVAEFGQPDIVLDDGCHVGRLQWASFQALFPQVKDGGLYAIEDTHTSYWPTWGGGFNRRDTASGLAKQIVDDMHGWYHNRETLTPARDYVGAMHVYDSVTVLEKRKKPKPGYLNSIKS